MAGQMSLPEPLWQPTHPEATPMSKYRQHINTKFNLSLKTSHELQKWSIKHKHDFWIDLWAYIGIVPPLPSSIKKAYDDSKSIRDIPNFFEGAEINFAENVLSGRDPGAIALIGLREGKSLDGEEQWMWADLTENVRKARSAMLRLGIQKEGRVAAMMSNSPWTIAIFLACASIGAVFTSISPDMGLDGCVSRLEQVRPAILFADSHQTYKGKQRSMHNKIVDVLEVLEPKPKLFKVKLAPVDDDYATLDDFLQHSSPLDRLEYLRVPFSQPLVILYSSGTTGPPKCVVHQHGVILQLKKVALLHNSLTPADTVFQYSSTSWVMWNIMSGHLSAGCKLICFDGSPLYPDAGAMLKILERWKCTYFGTSPRYLLELEMSGIDPSSFDLSALRMVTTTGAALAGDQSRWFYSRFPRSIHLSSIAGGTEILTSWMASDPASPVFAGEMQMPALGQDVDVGHSETGESILHTGEPGELICRTPFPSMPVCFLGDPGREKYIAAYFRRFEDAGVICWAQHDWIRFNTATGGAQIHGRSDGTLNPSGIRFGSAEIYSVVESPRFTFDRHINDTLCVGRKRATDRDETVFLFVKMQPGHRMGDRLVRDIQEQIRTQLSPRHVPKFVIQVHDIPVTINGKKVEIAIKKILNGEEVKPSATFANYEAMEEYKQYRSIETTPRSKL